MKTSCIITTLLIATIAVALPTTAQDDACGGPYSGKAVDYALDCAQGAPGWAEGRIEPFYRAAKAIAEDVYDNTRGVAYAGHPCYETARSFGIFQEGQPYYVVSLYWGEYNQAAWSEAGSAYKPQYQYADGNVRGGTHLARVVVNDVLEVTLCAQSQSLCRQFAEQGTGLPVGAWPGGPSPLPPLPNNGPGGDVLNSMPRELPRPLPENLPLP